MCNVNIAVFLTNYFLNRVTYIVEGALCVMVIIVENGINPGQSCWISLLV